MTAAVAITPVPPYAEPHAVLGPLDARAAAAHLQAARARLRALGGDLDGAQLLGPKLAIVNPPLWELGHVAWFQERWCLRCREDGSLAPGRLVHGDGLYDSGAVPHAARWALLLPDRDATWRYLEAVLEDVCGALDARPDDRRLAYFAELAACHEDMHNEAFHYTRQTLGYAAPSVPARAFGAESTVSGDAALVGGRFALGARPDTGFVFDNEKWAHPVTVRPFRMARSAVTNAEFLAFVQAGGYARREWWTHAGWAWREGAHALQPRYWNHHDGVWAQRRFAEWVRLEDDEPVVHVNAYEAQAWCRFAKRRLPSESEWEFAARSGGDGVPGPANLDGAAPVPVHAFAEADTPAGCRQLFGNVWEWTADTFGPYPGYVTDPYADYSQPWFGTHRVLRGGSFATPRRLLRATWRNFYAPDRGDPFLGFRTCALDD